MYAFEGGIVCILQRGFDAEEIRLGGTETDILRSPRIEGSMAVEPREGFADTSEPLLVQVSCKIPGT